MTAWDGTTGGFATPMTGRDADLAGVGARVAGRSTSMEIAALGIAPETVTHHLVTVFRILGVPSPAEAALWASTHGLRG